MTRSHLVSTRKSRPKMSETQTYVAVTIIILVSQHMSIPVTTAIHLHARMRRQEKGPRRPAGAARTCVRAGRVRRPGGGPYQMTDGAARARCQTGPRYRAGCCEELR